jgi:hypothetical protein
MEAAYATLVLRCGVQPSEIPRLTLRQIDILLNPPQGEIITLRDEAALASYMAGQS